MPPLLLDGQHHFTKLLILQIHFRLNHLGVRIILSELREEFWILRSRQAINLVLHSCLPCRMAKGLPGGEIEAPLSTDRVTPFRPFAFTGIDYAEPLFVKVGNTQKKSYLPYSLVRQHELCIWSFVWTCRPTNYS